MMKRKYLLILLMLAGLFSFADEVQFSMSAPSIVTVGEQFSLTLSLNAKGDDLRMPEINNFDVLMGPSVSSSRSIQIINGRTTQTVNYTYTYILRAASEGTFTISPATIKVNRKVYPSNEINIQVIKGRQQPNATVPPSGSGNQQTQTTANDGDQLFIRYEADKTNVYKGEQIMLTFKLYSRVALSIVDQTLPSFEGFWTQDIELPPAEQTRTREAVDGVIYNVYTLQKKILVPQQTGNLAIEPAEMVFDVQQRVRSQSVFDDFFGSIQNVRTKSKSKRIPITVKELPQAPAGFGGAVGRFTLSSSIDKTEVAANEALTLRVKVDGNGNLRHISPVKFNFPPDFEVYDPRTSYNNKPTEAGIVGSTSFEQVVIPRFAGNFTIPAQQFTYFDPAEKKFKTLFTKQFDITVLKGADDQSTTVMSSVSKEDLRFLGQDIRFIQKDNLKLNRLNDQFFGSFMFFGSYAIALLLFALALALQRKKARENANIALMRNKKASKMARKHLKAASICVKKNNTDDFFEALLKAFWGYLSDKLAIPVSELNRDNARTTLDRFSVDEATINEFIETIDICEMARYAPTAVNQSITELYKKAEKLIGKFEKQIRKRKS
jgi:hypothetical protein